MICDGDIIIDVDNCYPSTPGGGPVLLISRALLVFASDDNDIGPFIDIYIMILLLLFIDDNDNIDDDILFPMEEIRWWRDMLLLLFIETMMVVILFPIDLRSDIVFYSRYRAFPYYCVMMTVLFIHCSIDISYCCIRIGDHYNWHYSNCDIPDIRYLILLFTCIYCVLLNMKLPDNANQLMMKRVFAGVMIFVLPTVVWYDIDRPGEIPR